MVSCIPELPDRLRTLFKNADGDSKTANGFRKLDKNVQQILADMLVDMSIDAAEKLGTIKAAGMLDSLNNSGDAFKMTTAEIQMVQNIGRISVNQFSSANIKATERFAQQYWKEMGVKSPFFRAWFGDWRANDQTKVQIATQRGDTRGVQKNTDTGWDIQVSGKVFNETKIHTESYNIAARPYLPYINDIVKKAILLDTFGIDTKKPKSENSLLVHSLYAVADIGKGPEVIKLYVEEMNDPNQGNTAKRAYQLQNIEKYQPTGKSSQNAASSISPVTAGTIRTVADLFAAVKQKDSSFQPKPSSKVVNPDGTPKVLYHGTNASFTTFDKRKAKLGVFGKGFYFAPTEGRAKAYGSARIMKTYLSIKNPFIVNDSIGFTAEDYRNMQRQFGIADKINDGNVVRILQGQNYDGIMVNDSNGNLREVIAFEPEQIKSATDNIGTFDGDNPDIRYKVSAGDVGDKAASGQKKPSNSTASPLTRRPGNQGSVGSTQLMPSTAAAELFGIDNINDLNDSVKSVISTLAEMYISVDEQIPVLNFKKTITGSNLKGSLLKAGILQRGGTGASAYRYDNSHGLRVSNHSAKADNFAGAGEHLSLTLFEKGKMNDFVAGKANVIEAVFRVRYLDNNPETVPGEAENKAPNSGCLTIYHPIRRALAHHLRPGRTPAVHRIRGTS